MINTKSNYSSIEILAVRYFENNYMKLPLCSIKLNCTGFDNGPIIKQKGWDKSIDIIHFNKRQCSVIKYTYKQWHGFLLAVYGISLKPKIYHYSKLK